MAIVFDEVPPQDYASSEIGFRVLISVVFFTEFGDLLPQSECDRRYSKDRLEVFLEVFGVGIFSFPPG